MSPRRWILSRALCALAALSIVPATASASTVVASHADGSTLIAEPTSTTPEFDCSSIYVTNGIFDSCVEPSFSGATFRPAVTAQGGAGLAGTYYQVPGSDWLAASNFGNRPLNNHYEQYKTSFDRPAGGGSIGIRVLADNAIVDIFVNGHQISSCTRQVPCDGFTHPPFAVEIPDAYLQDTGNDLRITVMNFENTLATGGLNFDVVTRAPTVLAAAPDATGRQAGQTVTVSGSFTEPFETDAGQHMTLTADNTVGTFVDHGDGTWTWTYSPASAGSGTINVTATDGNGHGGTDAFNYSIAPPPDAIPPTTTSDAPSGWQNHAVTVHLSATDNAGGSGVASTHFSLDRGADQVGTSVPVSADGTHTVSYYSIDKNGNRETAHTATVQVDTTAPTITLTGRTTPNGNGWNNGDVRLTWSCTDNLSGAVAAGDSATVSTEGAGQSATGRCTDNAGNSSSDTEGAINVDKTAPVIAVTSRPDAGSWSNDDVTVKWSCSDALSGATADGDSATLSGEAAGQSATGTCQDKAGNSSTDTQDGINIDKTAPSITLASRTAANANGWNNGDVKLTWACSDALSGAKADGDSVTVSDDGADQSATGVCTDKAGNSSTDRQTGINIDTKAPSITPASRTAANANGWNNGDVKVVWSCSDALSGATAGGDSRTLSSEGAGQSATGTCTDKAGNSSSDTQKPINIDKTPPSVSYSGNQGSYTVADTVSIRCSASDALSGVASSTCKDVSGDAYTFALGANAFSASATDKADNTGNGATSFKVTVDSGSLCTLTRRWVTNSGIAGALCAKLDAAQASIARGDTNSKNGQLDAYRNQLSAQSGKAVAADKAAILAKLSQAL